MHSSAKIYNVDRLDGGTLYMSLANLDWSDVSSITDVEILCDTFFDKIYSCLDRIVPIQGPKRFSNNFPPWFNHSILMDLKLKEKHRKMSIKFNSQYHRDQYLGLRESI